jgi:hypothetical protein
VVCHATDVSDELAEHRERLEEAKSDHWIVCDYDIRDE